MLLKQVVGQEPAKEALRRMTDQNRIPHALLLAGSEGTGGLPLALAFAQYLFCTDKSDKDSCGQCANCRKVSRLEHADLHVSFPAVSPKPKTKPLSRHFIQEFREFISQTPYSSTYDWLQFIEAGNSQGNIPAEECREIIDNLNLKSYEGGKKIQIIWRPEYLGKEGNILLKLIEEPPADTLLLLVAESPEEVLATILSRTQLVRLAPLTAAEIAGGLTERMLADSKRAAQIAHLANGSFSEALSLVRESGNDLFPDVRNWFNAVFTGSGPEISRFAEEMSKAGREQQKNFLHYVIQLLHQTARMQFVQGFQPALPQDEALFVQKLSAHSLRHTVLQQMVDHISRTIYYIERNAHSKSQLHALSLRLVYTIKGIELVED